MLNRRSLLLILPVIFGAKKAFKTLSADQSLGMPVDMVSTTQFPKNLGDSDKQVLMDEVYNVQAFEELKNTFVKTGKIISEYSKQVSHLQVWVVRFNSHEAFQEWVRETQPLVNTTNLVKYGIRSHFWLL